ncbi:MBL fold metallo-hydrolase [Pseudomonas sp. NFX15]|uniref:MBL fold metallo-hydrolase n=1 Tax=Pseudomonas sp. NFX15 TaxID=2816958 RepID=UPI003B8C159A
MNRRISTLAGRRRRLDGGLLFGPTPRMQWAHWIAPDLDNTVEIAARVLLVQEQGKNILVMAGADSLLASPPRTCRCQPRVPGLLDSLALRALDENDIDVVVLTHVQAPLCDEMSERIREGEMPRLLFPRARFICGESHWHRARHPHPRDRHVFLSSLVNRLERSGRLSLINTGHCELLGDGWCFHTSDGFTPGQLLPQIELPGGPLLFCGDLIPGTHWLDLEVVSGRDRNAERVIDEKEHLLDHLVAIGGRLFFARDPEVAMVKIMRDRKSRYVPFDHYRTLNRFEG